jgi:rubrerythrin
MVCCAGLEYRWKCDRCHKVSTGLAIPHGKCFLCGGSVRVIQGFEFEDPMTVRPIRDAVQFELNSYHFYRLARSRTSHPLMRSIFDQLYQHEVDHLHLLQERYHTHLDDEVLNLRPEEDELLANSLFQGLDLGTSDKPALGIYDLAIDMERRTRDHFHSLARILPEGPEQDVCLELAAEEDEHVAMLETERQQFVEPSDG